MLCDLRNLGFHDGVLIPKLSMREENCHYFLAIIVSSMTIANYLNVNSNSSSALQGHN